MTHLYILFGLFFSIFLSAQCTGNFGEPVFTQNFGFGAQGTYGPELAPGTTTYIYKSFADITPNLEDGEYTIATKANLGRPDWHNTFDFNMQYTGQPGYMLLVNAAYDAGEFYRERVSDLCLGQNYQLSFFVMNVLPDNVLPNSIPINVKFQVFDANGMLITESDTGDIYATNHPIWNRMSFEFELNSSQPYVDIVLVNNGAGGMGNDLAIDEIQIRACQSQSTALTTSSAAFTTGLQNNQSDFAISVDTSSVSYSNPVYVLEQSRNNGLTWIEIGQNSIGNFTILGNTYNDGDLFRILISEDINVGNLNCSIIAGPKQVLISAPVDTTWSITVCDDDYDGITTFNFDEILTQLNQEFQDSGIQEDLVYIANSYDGLIKIENVSTNPNRVHVCNSSWSLYEVAVDQNKDVYVSSRTGLYLVNTDNCTYQNLGQLPYSSNLAMSFDTQNNLYVGGFHSSVYRADAGQFDDYYEWHNFGSGSSGGDFVVIGEFMYIAWAMNNDYYLYKVTLDDDNQYVSHVSMGLIDTDTFGLAAENGRLYGVTPNYLYSIELPSLRRERIIQNSSTTPWWGAAGLHEAISFDFTFHLTSEEAQNGTNPLESGFSNTTPNYQQVFIRIYNETTGEVQIIALDLTVNTPPETQATTMYQCAGGNTTNVFNLTDAISEMLEDTSGINISYFTSQQNAENQNGQIQNSNALQTQSGEQIIYVRFANGDCVSYNTITLQSDAQSLDLGNNVSICEGQAVTIGPIGNFDSYQWTGLQGEDLNNNDVNANQITVSNPGTYSLTVGYGDNCSITEEIVVTEESLPLFADQTLSFCAEDNSLSMNASELISSLNQVNPAFSYTLFNSPADAQTNLNPITGSVNVTNNQNLIIRVKNTASSNCFSLNELTIQLNPLPAFEWQENYSICEGETQLISVPGNFVSYQWSGLKGEDVENNNVNANQVEITQAGTYTIEVTNEHCATRKEVNITYDDAANIEQVQIQGNNASIIASGNPPLQYSFDGVNWSSNPNANNLETGEYTAYVKGENVCGITEMNFALFSFTNVITPNNDGYNDYWEVKGLNSYPDSNIQIYNRYGKLLVDQRIGNEFRWYGTFKGSPLPSGTYWYVLDVSDGRGYSGHITVKNYR